MTRMFLGSNRNAASREPINACEASTPEATMLASAASACQRSSPVGAWGAVSPARDDAKPKEPMKKSLFDARRGSLRKSLVLMTLGLGSTAVAADKAPVYKDARA